MARVPPRTLVFPYDPVVPRPPLGPGDRTIQLGEAARRLGVTRSTLQGRVKAKDPSIRGLAPASELNPGHRWLVSLDDVEAELRGKGLLDTPTPPVADVSVDAMRVEMLQGALSDSRRSWPTGTPKSLGCDPSLPPSAGPSKSNSSPQAAPSLP
jgi:hypothetical protein